MKNFIVITLLSFFIFSCNNSGNNGKTDTTSTPTATTPIDDNHAGHDHAGHDHGETTHHKASPLSPYIGIWTYFASTHNPDYYKNRWIELKGDGSFESGQTGQPNNSGTWTLDATNKLIEFDYKDNSVDKDEQWKTQINPPVLLLLGNSPKNKTGAQIKLDLVEQRPL